MKTKPRHITHVNVRPYPGLNTFYAWCIECPWESVESEDITDAQHDAREHYRDNQR